MSPMPRHSDTDVGWIKREHRKLWKAIRESSAAKRLEAATIGRGGVTIKGGGALRVPYPNGSEGITVGADPVVTSGNDLQTDAIVQMREEDGVTNVFSVYRLSPGTDDAFPDGRSVLNVNVDNLAMTSSGGDMLLISGPDGALVFAQPGTGLILSSDNGVTIDASTTASAANCVIDPVSGLIQRSTSSRRYKRDLQDLDVDVDAILALTPQLCRLKTEVDELGDDAPTYAVFIAEEAADLGLDPWVTSDDQGPEAFDYAGFCVAQQLVLRRQQRTIEDLEQRLTALENEGRSTTTDREGL